MQEDSNIRGENMQDDYNIRGENMQETIAFNILE